MKRGSFYVPSHFMSLPLSPPMRVYTVSRESLSGCFPKQLSALLSGVTIFSFFLCLTIVARPRVLRYSSSLVDAIDASSPCLRAAVCSPQSFFFRGSLSVLFHLFFEFYF